MGLFSVMDSTNVTLSPEARSGQGKKSEKAVKGEKRGKPYVSPDEIRRKVREHFGRADSKVEISQKAKSMASKKEKVDETPKAPGAIMGNDPNDSITHSKLKDALQSGMVNFSDREKTVLSKILQK